MGGRLVPKSVAGMGRKTQIQRKIMEAAHYPLNAYEFFTPLMRAAYHGNKEIVVLLLNRGTHVEVKNANGQTPLILAAIQHDDEEEWMNGKRILILRPFYFWHQLSHDRVKTMRLLLRKGAAIDAEDKNGMTALMYAAQIGHKGALKTLLAHNADVHRKNLESKTALMLANERGHRGIVKILERYSTSN
jgi:ankyrin repeat protein